MNHKIKLQCTYVLLITLSFSAFSAQEIPLRMKLKQCPNSPNCVSSQSHSESSRITPLSYKLSETEAMEKIKNIILGLPRTKLIKQTNQFLHIEFKTAILRFVDDVDIVINDNEKVIHLRSASRLGYWDLGTNRRRIEIIKKKFME